ncbi:MAG: glycosyltransferase [Gammaproteobacteria bacterium]|nr:glycosyltransferase [Gammaproteobacteria bacterium]
MFENNNLKLEDLFKGKKKITVVGPFPPPLGGVSVFLERFCNLYSVSRRIDFKGGGIVSYISLFASLYKDRDCLCFLNVKNNLIFAIVVFLSRFTKAEFVFMDHNEQTFQGGVINIAMTKSFLRSVKYVVVVGRHMINNYAEHAPFLAGKIWVENAFLPPNLSERSAVLDSYPPEYFRFIASKNVIINTSAFKVKFENGVDLYGIDMSLKALKYLKDSGINSVGALIFIADIDSGLKYVSKMVRALELSGDVLIISGQRELWPSYLDSDVSIRATSRDGYGVTVAESISLGCAAIASDVCARAEGAIIFRNRDQQDLNAKVLSVISEHKFKRN